MDNQSRHQNTLIANAKIAQTTKSFDIFSIKQVFSCSHYPFSYSKTQLLTITMLLCKEFVNNRLDLYNSYSLMQLRQLFANVLVNPKELKVESKEQFFNTKHRQRRMKKSTCFSEQIEIEQNQNTPLNSSHASYRSDDRLNGCCKELQSTFGEENALAFRPKPPKRKRNLRINNDKQKKEESQSSSDSESSTKNSLILSKKTAETFRSNLDIFQKSSTGGSNFKISDFCILGKIGQGSYSEVYKAIDKHTGFLCALKVLEKWKMKELSVQENVIREIKLNMFLNHPNIAKLYACFHDQHYIYLITEYATNNNLYELIKQPKINRKETNSEKVTKLVGQICEAVRYIHQHCVIHRDIKPENILLTMGSTVKVCDFGWSIYNPNNEMRLTLCGTPLYLAPEMVAQISYDESVDIWAIGVITYELLTEESPFKITQLRDLSKIINEDIKLDAIDNQKASDFIQHAMQKNPNKRKSIFELCRHPFISHFFQSNQAV